MDIVHSSDYIIAHGLSEDVYDRLIEKQMVDIKQHAMGEFSGQDNIKDYFIINNLVKCGLKNKNNKQFLLGLENQIFDSNTVNLIITNDIFNQYLITRLFSSQIRFSPLKITDETHFSDNLQLFDHLKTYVLCGNYYKLPGYMARVMGVMSYFY